MAARFEVPEPGAPAPVRFPPIARESLANGLGVWVIPRGTLPLVSVALILPRGTADDPADRAGLAAFTGDLVDEGAGTRDAIALADALARMGTELSVDVGPDATSLTLTVLSKYLAPTFDLLADVVRRPMLAEPDFARVRDLRLSRLRQLSRAPGTLADRAFVTAIFGGHPYGHGALGTTGSVELTTVDDVRGFWASKYGPAGATLVVSGDASLADVSRAAHEAFGTWETTMTAPAVPVVVASPDPRILFVSRPGAAQSELRVGHLGPPRATPAFHALVTLNAVLGGQFTSRLNQRLRQEKGVTYGANTAFDFRRVGGVFAGTVSVQGDATAGALSDMLAEFEAVRGDGAVGAEELDRAQASLTRGYARNFETAGQLARAAVQLAVHGLDDGTFDRFVPRVEAVTAAELGEAAHRFVRPADATVVVVGDEALVRPSLEGLGRVVATVAPEF